MSQETKDFVIRLFACVVAFAFVFMIVAIVGGFIAARLLGLEVNVDKFYGVVGPAFTMILTAVLGWLAVGSRPSNKSPNDDQGDQK